MPKADIIKMGIGDVTHPLTNSIVTAMEKAAKEMAESSTFRGYGPEQGYDFLVNAVILLPAIILLSRYTG